MITQNRYFVGICTVIMALGAMITTATANQHHALDTVPCDIKLIFGTDNQGKRGIFWFWRDSADLGLVWVWESTPPNALESR